MSPSRTSMHPPRSSVYVVVGNVHLPFAGRSSTSFLTRSTRGAVDLPATGRSKKAEMNDLADIDPYGRETDAADWLCPTVRSFIARYHLDRCGPCLYGSRQHARLAARIAGLGHLGWDLTEPGQSAFLLGSHDRCGAWVCGCFRPLHARDGPRRAALRLSRSGQHQEEHSVPGVPRRHALGESGGGSSSWELQGPAALSLVTSRLPLWYAVGALVLGSLGILTAPVGGHPDGFVLGLGVR